MHYRARKVDANQTAIIAAFERMGCSVADLSSMGKGICDILVGHGGLCILVEIKSSKKITHRKEGQLTPAQERFWARWTGGRRLVQDNDDVAATVALLRYWHATIRTAALP